MESWFARGVTVAVLVFAFVLMTSKGTMHGRLVPGVVLALRALTVCMPAGYAAELVLRRLRQRNAVR